MILVEECQPRQSTQLTASAGATWSSREHTMRARVWRDTLAIMEQLNSWTPSPTLQTVRCRADSPPSLQTSRNRPRLTQLPRPRLSRLTTARVSWWTSPQLPVNHQLEQPHCLLSYPWQHSWVSTLPAPQLLQLLDTLNHQLEQEQLTTPGDLSQSSSKVTIGRIDQLFHNERQLWTTKIWKDFQNSIAGYYYSCGQNNYSCDSDVSFVWWSFYCNIQYYYYVIIIYCLYNNTICSPLFIYCYKMHLQW